MVRCQLSAAWTSCSASLLTVLLRELSPFLPAGATGSASCPGNWRKFFYFAREAQREGAIADCLSVLAHPPSPSQACSAQQGQAQRSRLRNERHAIRRGKGIEHLLIGDAGGEHVAGIRGIEI